MASRKRKLNNSGILSNSYIPPLPATQLERELQKLPPDSLYSLTHLWLSIPATQPIPTTSQTRQGTTKQSLSQDYIKQLDSLSKINSKQNLKKKLINTILVEFYPRGLNTLQLAQIDVQLLVDRPNTNLWVSSTAKIVNKTSDVPSEENEIDEEKIKIRDEKLNQLSNYTFSLDSQLFLDNFIANLSNLFLTHVYISRHPYYPLLLIRIQMYNHSYKKPIDAGSRMIINDLTNESLDRMAKLKFEEDFQRIVNNKLGSNNNKTAKNGLQRQIQIRQKPQVIPHKPFYILLPISSPHIIHTPVITEDVSSKLIMQTLESTLSHSNVHSKLKSKPTKLNQKIISNSSIIANTRIKIFSDSDVASPIRNLNTIFTLKGISRFGTSLGAWSPYADNIVDIAIFGEETNHQTLQPENYIDLTEDDENGDKALAERRHVAALKFKGSMSKIKSKKLFDEIKDTRREKVEDIELIDEINEIQPSSNNNSFLETQQEKLEDDPYASVVPIHECKFEIEDNVAQFFNQRNRKKKNKAKTFPASTFTFKMDLYGSDVFGGLHELAVDDYVDPYHIPDWLTGESGLVGGVIKRGKIMRKK